MKFFVVALLGLVAVQAAVAPAKLKGQALVDYINANAKTWKAELQTTINIKNRLMRPEFVNTKPSEFVEEAPELEIDATIPDSFDGRAAWPKCPSIGSIRDQSDCGSCWAFGAAECITDRTCIALNGAKNDILAADDILACCGDVCGDGCNGGYPIQAWIFWVHKGVCTGSSFQSNQGCKPYPIPPCGPHNKTYNHKCPDDGFPTPECDNKCQSGYPISYANDKHYGKSAYSVSQSVAAIQKEIMTYGPVEAAFTVFSDFMQYTSGVYQYTWGGMEGGHAVRIIGWGTDKKTGTPYWLVANSWDTDWGESGFFRIRRGTNECDIEANIVAGLAK